jgi:ERCC4-type nuclease
MTKNTYAQWNWLRRVPGIGPVLWRRLQEHYRSVPRLFDAARSGLLVHEVQRFGERRQSQLLAQEGRWREKFPNG